MFEIANREFTLGDAEDRAFSQCLSALYCRLPLPGGDLGSGTLVRWKSIGLVLTANHNLDGTKLSEVRFCFYPGASLRDGPMSAEDLGYPYRGNCCCQSALK